jgi:phosphoglycolate phosphatase-like HAD superfamily hydrolase
MKKPIIDLVITDLDNTLYDWFEPWYHAFSAFLDRLERDSGIPRQLLIQEIKQIHERHQTSEYAFLLQEIPSLQALHPGEDIVRIYDDAVHEYSRARKQHLSLYPGVLPTLDTLKRNGVMIVGYTESMGFYSASRVRALGLDGMLEVLYSPEDHSLPQGSVREKIRKYPAESYDLQRTAHRHTPRGELKPNPAVLLDIVREVGGDVETSVYIGDSLIKDVSMAQDAGIMDVHAKYGTAHTRGEYELLRSVTHWTAEQVERERMASSRMVQPTFVLERSFQEILDLFELHSFRDAPLARAQG